MERKQTPTPLAFPEAAPTQSSEILYRSLVESLTEYAVFAVSPAGAITTWNAGAQKTFGYDVSEVVGKSFALIFTPEDAAAGAPRTELADAHQGGRTHYERWHVRKDGTRFWATNTIAPIYNAAGALIGFTKLVADTTESYRAREALRDSEERLRLLIESVPEYAIFSLALDGSITTWSSTASNTLGYAEHEILGKPFAQLFAPEDVANGVPAIVLEKARAWGALDEERWFVRKDGSRFLGSEKVSRIKQGSKTAAPGFVHVVHDITERNQVADEMRRRAMIDQLTELPNRGTFLEHLHRAIAAIKRRSTNLFAVLFIDLDDFKEVNDTFGHIVADRLLEITARRLERCARAEDVVARIGGDEFAILLNGINDLGDANDAADRISAEMRRAIPIDTHTVRATVSVGIAIGSPRYDRPEDVLRDADAAMYDAKAGGRGRSVVFGTSSAAGGRSEFDLETDLRHAIERNELWVAYQPVMRLADASIVGFEALVRWQHPRRGLLQPGEFILRAEQSESIVALDRWVLREACTALASWRTRFTCPDLAINVNFSSKEFSDPRVLDELRSVLSTTGLPPGLLHIEITESSIMERSDRTTALLGAIRALGVELHVDDFGVGYSSLAALGRMPVHALKIDRSFIADIDSRKGALLVHTITHLAHNLGLAAIAEGIETVEQLNGLIAVKCEYGQGFLFSEPLDVGRATQFLAQTL